MKTVGLKGSKRESVGKSETKKVRNEGNVPCVMYSGGNEGTHFSASHKDLVKVMYSPEVFIIQVDLDGEMHDTLIRDSQFHPVTDKILHVDFLKVGDVEVEFELPVNLVGAPKGVFAGGKLVTMMRRIKVRGIPSKMPAKVDVNVANLELGKTIRVSEVQAPGITITSPPQSGVARVEIPRALRSAQADAAAAAAAGGEKPAKKK